MMHGQKNIELPNCRYSRTPLIRTKWDGESSGYAEDPDNRIFLWKLPALRVWIGKQFLQTAVLCYVFNYIQIKH